jgi:hypothetical protein
MAGVTLADLGGPVHPHETKNADGSVSVWYGLNVRDYFAAAALQGLLANASEVNDELAAEAFTAADAMLAARERKDSSA